MQSGIVPVNSFSYKYNPSSRLNVPISVGIRPVFVYNV